jgi:hypothetical protein
MSQLRGTIGRPGIDGDGAVTLLDYLAVSALVGLILFLVAAVPRHNGMRPK